MATCNCAGGYPVCRCRSGFHAGDTPVYWPRGPGDAGAGGGYAWPTYSGTWPPVGCVCPPTSEQTCQNPNCGRKPSKPVNIT